MRSGTVATDIDSYIAAAPSPTQPLLQKLRATIAKAAPDAEEAIVYGLPTFRLHGNLVHFGVFARHIGFYPGPAAVTAHADELSGYVTSKGAIQFPLDAPLPLALVARITKYRVQVSVELAALKAAKKKMSAKKAAAPKTATTRAAATPSTMRKSATKNAAAKQAAASSRPRTRPAR